MIGVHYCNYFMQYCDSDHGFYDWYSEQVGLSLENDAYSPYHVDLRTSVIKHVKTIHARWVISAHEIIAEKSQVIRKGFLKAGLP